MRFSSSSVGTKSFRSSLSHFESASRRTQIYHPSCVARNKRSTVSTISKGQNAPPRVCRRRSSSSESLARPRPQRSIAAADALAMPKILLLSPPPQPQLLRECGSSLWRRCLLWSRTEESSHQPPRGCARRSVAAEAPPSSSELKSVRDLFFFFPSPHSLFFFSFSFSEKKKS